MHLNEGSLPCLLQLMLQIAAGKELWEATHGTKRSHLAKEEKEEKENNESHGSVLRGDIWEGERGKASERKHFQKDRSKSSIIRHFTCTQQTSVITHGAGCSHSLASAQPILPLLRVLGWILVRNHTAAGVGRELWASSGPSPVQTEPLCTLPSGTCRP